MTERKKQVFDLVVKLVGWERREQGARSLAALLCREYGVGDVLVGLNDFVAEIHRRDMGRRNHELLQQPLRSD